MPGESTSYKTLKRPVESVVFKDRRSKFIGYAFPIESQEEVKELLERLWGKYSDATHICYAWQLGVQNINYRVQDDGEPRNSAGMPIYGQIKSFGITNTVVFVVRYFGGVKLGVGGLIQAYRSAARETLQRAVITKNPVLGRFRLNFAYDQISSVMRLLNTLQAEIENQDMAETAVMQVAIPIRNHKKFQEAMKKLPKVEWKEQSS